MADEEAGPWNGARGDGDRFARALGHGWNLAATLGRTVDDRPCLLALGIERDEAAGPPEASGIGSLQWRAVNVGEVLDQLVALGRDRDEWRAEVAQEEEALEDFQEDDWALRGRSGHSPLAYARLALAYDVMIRNGVRTPKQDLAEAMHCSVPTVSTRLAKARDLYLLSPAQPGVPGGHLTSAGRELIDAAYPVRPKAAKR